MKKMMALLLAMVMLLGLAACKKTCKQDGCENEPYEEGYCKFHYAMETAKDGLDQIGQGIADLIG